MQTTARFQRQKIVITGGSGFLGVNLARHLLARGYEVVIISRNPPRETGAWRHVAWDGETLGEWTRELEGCRGVVNLAGKSVDCIKTPDNQDLILRSRVLTTRLMGEALALLGHKPEVWVQMSTAHIYGDPPSTVCDEDAPTGFGLAPTVGRAWEHACREAVPDGVRLVILRTSFVLGRRGGALKRLSLLARLGLGGTVGSGRQGMSWLHEEDMNRLFTRAIENPSMSGTYVATAPNPVSNRRFMKALRQALHMPLGLPASAWMVRLAAPLVLKTDPELALYGRFCVSRRLAEEGFAFRFTEVEEALKDVFARKDGEAPARMGANSDPEEPGYVHGPADPAGGVSQRQTA